MSEKKYPIEQHYEDIKDVQRIMRELKRTADTNGCYCPFNKTYPHQAKVVKQIREILREKIETKSR